MTWLSWPFRLLAFLAWYTHEVIRANVTVLRDNLTPGQHSTPGIARVRTRCRTDLELTVLAALITLTPGTLTMGTDTDHDTGQRVLFVHGMYFPTANALRQDIHAMETRMLHALRRNGDPS